MKNKTDPNPPLADASGSPSVSSGLRPTPITDSFEMWWAENRDKCEVLVSELGVKEAIEFGFFGGHER